MIYTVYLTSFCTFYTQNYLGYFVQGQFHLPTTPSFLWRQGIKPEVLLGFENFQIVTHRFLGCQFLENIGFFILGSFKCIKKNSGYFAMIEYVISRYISRCTFRIYIVLYGYKPFLPSYVVLKIKNVKFCKFKFLPFLAPLPHREAVKQLSDSWV